MPFVEALKWLATFGLLEVVIPFVLAFAITYGILDKTKVLGVERGQPRRKLNAIVALVIALFFVGSMQIVTIVKTFLLWFTAFLVFLIIALAFFIFLTGKEKFETLIKTKSYLAIGVAIVLLALIGATLGVFKIISSKALGTFLLVALVLGIFIAIIHFITYEKRPTEKTKSEPELPKPETPLKPE